MAYPVVRSGRGVAAGGTYPPLFTLVRITQGSGEVAICPD